MNELTLNLDKLLRHLPTRQYSKLIDVAQLKTAAEIRIRAGRCIQLSEKGQNILVAETEMTQQEITEFISSLSGHSLHSIERRLAEGSFMFGGFRIGVAGQLSQNEYGCHISNISSVCIRIPRDHKGIASQLLQHKTNLLILGSPSSGKTSMLRDYINSKSLGKSPLNTVVIDETGEIAPFDSLENKPLFGGSVDILTGYKKDNVIRLALKCLAPQLIAVDEIETDEDAAALIRCCSAGVRFICTAHISDERNIRNMSHLNLLMSSCDNLKAVILSQPNNPGIISKIVDCRELI